MASRFRFKIPAGSIGTSDPASDTWYQADRGMGRSVKQRVLTAKFGDGYEQRVLDGVNAKQDEFSVSFKNRNADEVNEMAAFFDAYAGKNFEFEVTDHAGNTSIKVVCEDYNIVYIAENYHTLAAKFRRVYEP